MCSGGMLIMGSTRLSGVGEMPGDAVHVKWAQIAAFVASVVMYAGGVDLLHILLLAGIFMFGTKYVSPDLDINSIPYHRWGVLRVFFWPFLKLVPHRDKWSHNIILGPIVLVAYFSLVLVFIGTILNQFWLPVVEPMIDRAQEMLTQVMTLQVSSENMAIILPVIGCLLAAAVLHIIVDTVFTGDRQS